MPGTQSVMSSGHDLEVSTEEGELQSAGLVSSQVFLLPSWASRSQQDRFITLFTNFFSLSVSYLKVCSYGFFLC